MGILDWLLYCGVMAWCTLLTSMAVFPGPKSIEEQAAYNRLLFNLTVPSVPQDRQWAKLNLETRTSKVHGLPQFTVWCLIAWPAHVLIVLLSLQFTLPNSFHCDLSKLLQLSLLTLLIVGANVSEPIITWLCWWYSVCMYIWVVILYYVLVQNYMTTSVKCKLTLVPGCPASY